MSTELLLDATTEQAELPTIEHAPELSPDEAKQRFRQSVIDGVCDLAICEAAEMSEAEWHQVRKLFPWRQNKARDMTRIKATLPQLEQAAREAAAAVTSMADSMRATQAQMALDGARLGLQGAESSLLCTAANPPADPNYANLKYSITDLVQRIASRRETINADRLIEAQRERIANLVSGKISITDQSEWTRAFWAGPPAGEQVDRENARLLSEAKAELTRLLTLVKGKEQAALENQADEAALVDLRRDLEAIDHERCLWQLVPENLRWGD